MSENTINFLTVSPSELDSALDVMIDTKNATFLWGAAGIGKSSIIAKKAKDKGMDFVDFRLSQVDACDLRGVPYRTSEFDHTKKKEVDVVKWSVPSALKPKSDRPVLYLLDEMNAAPPSIQAAAYQWVLDRKIGDDFELRDCDVIIAAGNRESDKGTTFRMAAPLANRFVHLELKVNFDDWQEYASKNNFSPEVIGFLTQFKSYLHDWKSTHTRGFATPRSWEMVSNIVRVVNQKYTNSKEAKKVLTPLVCGAIGQEIGVKFVSFRDQIGKLPKTEDIFTKKITSAPELDIGLSYALCLNCMFDLKDELAAVQQQPTPTYTKINDRIDNTIDFFMSSYENKTPELIVFLVKQMIQIHGIIGAHNFMSSKAVNKFRTNYGHLLPKY